MFDPYDRWLAIPPDQRPPSLYQILGVLATESDPEAIREAALRQASHVRAHQTGPHAEECTRILNEIGQACATLTNPSKRREYDERLSSPGLGSPLVPGQPPPPVTSEPPPVAPPPDEGLADGFGFDAAGAGAARPHHKGGRRRHTRASFWTEPAAYLYVLLLCGGVGLGFWAARLAHPPASATIDKTIILPPPPVPRLGGPGKTPPPRKPDPARTPRE